MCADRIIECVPNFSEGRDLAVIERITASMGAVEGALVLDVDPGRATNRTVVTLAGEPESVLRAAFLGIQTAAELIDMRNHHGEHPRMGATDVCPFVPVRGVEMKECVALARELGRRVGDELGIPVFLYEQAALNPARQNLAEVRKGEYEGLEARLEDPAQAPDFGPSVFQARSGATAIGARKFLIAYNVNLNTRSKKIATEIALEIREQGRNQRGPDGRFIRDKEGRPVKRPGLLKKIKAVGWVIEEYGRAQVSCNLTDFEVTNLHQVFDACDEHARKIGARVTGSELVGLVPLEAMLRAGRHYLQRAGESTGVPEARIIEAAVQSLGLAELAPFDPAEKIIEYRIKKDGESLAAMTVSAFLDELSSDSPAPGGGSVAALCGALGASLNAMVANLTFGKKAHRPVWQEMERLAQEAQQHKAWYLRAMDADTEAFRCFMAALRQKQGTKEEATRRLKALEAARLQVTTVPLSVLQKVPELLDLAVLMVEKGNPQAASDAATAAACALACATGAYDNVLTNLHEMPEDSGKAALFKAASASLAEVREKAEGVQRRFLALMGVVAPGLQEEPGKG